MHAHTYVIVCDFVFQVSMKTEFIPTRKEAVKVVRKANVLDQMPTKAQQARTPMVETKNHENTVQETPQLKPVVHPTPTPAPTPAPAPAPVVAAAPAGPPLPPVSLRTFNITIILGLAVSMLFHDISNCNGSIYSL